MFDMPKSGSWEVRGGWVTRRLAGDLSFQLFQAAGVVGNLGAETEGFTLMQEVKPLVQGSRGGFGWAQWTGPRRVAFERWAKDHGLPVASDEANYGFLVSELRVEYINFAMRLRRLKTIEDATRLTHREYETPADVLDGSYRSYSKRLRYAKRALNGALIVSAPSPADTDAAMVVHETAAAAYQRLLRRDGFYNGEIDGQFGPRSWSAHLAYRKLYHSE